MLNLLQLNLSPKKSFVFISGYDPYDIDSAEEEDPMSPTPATVRSTVSRSSRSMDETTVSSAPKEIAADRLTAFKASLTKLFKEVCCTVGHFVC